MLFYWLVVLPGLFLFFRLLFVPSVQQTASRALPWVGGMTFVVFYWLGKLAVIVFIVWLVRSLITDLIAEGIRKSRD
jgi:low temperature requirement protein LtrA